MIGAIFIVECMLTQVASSRHTPYAIALVHITARRRDFYRISIAVAIRFFDPSLFTRLIVPTALSRVSSMGVGFHYTTMLLKVESLLSFIGIRF